MRPPALDEQTARTRRADRIESSLRAERLRERAAAIRGLRRGTHNISVSRATGDGAGSRERPGRMSEWNPSTQRSRDQAEKRESQNRRRDLESVQARVDRARAAAVLSSVRTAGWWDKATAGDLERAVTVANAPETPASSRVAIRTEMQDVTQRRYGTSVDGAIRYERENPQQPPPDIRNNAGRVLS